MFVITVARKPLGAANVAANVLEHGTGGLNIDAVRVAPVAGEVVRPGSLSEPSNRRGEFGGTMGFTGNERAKFQEAQLASIERTNRLGRWPSNVVLKHSSACTPKECIETCPVWLLDEQSGSSRSSGFGGRVVVKRRTGADVDGNLTPRFGAETRPSGAVMSTYDDEGGASRFFKQIRESEG